MSEKTIQLNGVKSTRKLRVGRVTIYLRGKIWYLYYCENGRRVRQRDQLGRATELTYPYRAGSIECLYVDLALFSRGQCSGFSDSRLLEFPVKSSFYL